MNEEKIREAFGKVRDDMNELKAEVKKLAKNYEDLAIKVRKKGK